MQKIILLPKIIHFRKINKEIKKCYFYKLVQVTTFSYKFNFNYAQVTSHNRNLLHATTSCCKCIWKVFTYDRYDQICCK